MGLTKSRIFPVRYQLIFPNRGDWFIEGRSEDDVRRFLQSEELKKASKKSVVVEKIDTYDTAKFSIRK